MSSFHDMTYHLLGLERNGLHEVEAAIQRIQTGRYGRCEVTGEPIAEARLLLARGAEQQERAQHTLNPTNHQ